MVKEYPLVQTYNGTRKMYVRKSIILLTCMMVLPHAVSLQSRGQRSDRRAGRLYRVVNKENKTGFIDKTGKLFIGFDRLPKTTAYVRDFHEGHAAIYLKKEKHDETKGHADYAAGYIDETGGVAIAPRFDQARDFSEGLAYVAAKGFRGFIDRRGRAVNKVDGYVKDFHEGLAAARAGERGGAWGYIDRAGRLVIKPQYQFADDFSEGMAGVAVGMKYGFINKRGEMVIPPRFGVRRAGNNDREFIISSGRFSEGLACVRLGELYGYINKQGDFVIPPRFLSAQDFSEGLAWVVTRDEETRVAEKVGWIDKSERWVVSGVGGRMFVRGLPEFFSHANELLDWRFSEGLVPFILYSGESTLRGYMDRNGKVRVEPKEFDAAGPFVGGVARVSFRIKGRSGSEEAYGYIDRRGRFIWRSE